MKKMEKWIFDESKKYHQVFFLLGLIVVFLVIYITQYSLSMDEIWNYGFAYNITQGLIPYRDFNMIVTPLFSWQLALLIKIFGNMFIIYSIYSSILSGIIQYYLVKKNGIKAIFVFPCIVLINYMGYNLLVLLLFVIYLNIKETKRSEYINGLLVALMLLTKQTIGGVMLIYSFFKSKNKKQFLIGFLPLCILFLEYLIMTNSVYDFFNYCLFGMFDFTGANTASHVEVVIIFYILMVAFLVYLNVKNKFKNDELVYIFLFQIMAAPIFDFVHSLLAIIPFLGYLLSRKILNKKEFYIFITGTTFFIFYSFFSIIITYIQGGTVYHNPDSFLNNKRIVFDMSCMNKVQEKINNEYRDYNTYHLNSYAYLYKLENKKPINKFDLTNKGNMGYHGDEKYIKIIDDDCKKNKCLLIIDYDSSGSQENMTIRKYVEDNYKHVESFCEFEWYTNEKGNSTLEKNNK